MGGIVLRILAHERAKFLGMGRIESTGDRR
jgi:hypothetical protein